VVKQFEEEREGKAKGGGGGNVSQEGEKKIIQQKVYWKERRAEGKWVTRGCGRTMASIRRITTKGGKGGRYPNLLSRTSCCRGGGGVLGSPGNGGSETRDSFF